MVSLFRYSTVATAMAPGVVDDAQVRLVGVDDLFSLPSSAWWLLLPTLRFVLKGGKRSFRCDVAKQSLVTTKL